MNATLKTQTILGVVILLLLSAEVMANSVGIGIGRATEYPGSGDYGVLPNAAFELDTPLGKLKNNQIGVQLDIIKNTNIDTGPILRANFGRDDSVSNKAVAALEEVSPSAEFGWFVNSGVKLGTLGIPSDAILIGRLDAVTDVNDGHGGTLVSGSVGLVFQLTDKFRVVPSVGFNYADDSYTDAFYTVSAAGAAASGLSEFKASGGLEYTQVALYGVRTIDERWSVTGTFAYNSLEGDAADSPITQSGTDKQLFTGLVINYAF